MRITDEGLDQILSLGLIRTTDLPAVYYLYSWESTDYYCGLAPSKKDFQMDGVFISLSDDQFEKLPISENKASEDPKLKKLSEYFQTVVYLKHDKLKDCLTVSEFYGQNTKAVALNIDLLVPSPFRINKETLKPFHGFCELSPKFKEALKKSFFKTDQLWISSCPVFEGSNLIGVIAGFSDCREYGLDVLKELKDFKPRVA